MKFTFKDIDNEKIYVDSNVVFAVGAYPIFINIVVDMLKDTCRVDVDETADILDEFDFADTGNLTNNNVDFDTFIDVVKMPNINGRWICVTSLNELTKKQLEKLNTYIKSPSENGLLVVTSIDFKEYSKYLSNRSLCYGTRSHIVQLSFPSRQKLVDIVNKIFLDYNLEVTKDAINLFIIKMGNNYEEYRTVIETNIASMFTSISTGDGVQATKTVNVDYKTMLECMKGVENYILDDFIEQLTEPLTSDKIVKNRKVYKMLMAMVDEFGARALVSKLRYSIDDIITMREVINIGYVPMGVKYSVEEAKRRLGEEHPFYKISEYKFRKLVEIASKTSLKDWVSMKMILMSPGQRAQDSEYEKALNTLVNRSVFCDSRLTNDIGLTDILETDFNEIHKIRYVDR